MMPIIRIACVELEINFFIANEFMLVAQSMCRRLAP